MAANQVRMPKSPGAQLRADMRRLGMRVAARHWGISPVDGLLIAAGLPARRSAVAAVLRRILKEVEG